MFPEAFKCLTFELAAISIDDSINCDLIILGYQPWFLSICIPINSFLKSEKTKLIFNVAPVVTLFNCRNVLVNAR
jgi:hypothetical protein